MFAILDAVPSRVCIVSYRDYSDMEHSVEVSPETLYEAAVLALKAFRKSLPARLAPARRLA